MGEGETHTPAGIAIWGYGREGRAAHGWLARTRPAVPVWIIDDRDDIVPDRPVAGVLSPREAIRRAGRDFGGLIRSPGVSIYGPDYRAVLAEGVWSTSGTDLWLRAHGDLRVGAVTGTKGKSTVATLAAHVLERSGRRVALLGNMGAPLLGADPGADATILELSSYQTSDLHSGPGVAVITNLFSDHLNWHGTRARYHTDKMNLARRAAHVIIPADMPEIGRGLASVQAFLVDGFTLHEGEVRKDGHLIAVNFPLRGDHNLRNLSAALALAEAVGGALAPPVDFAGYAVLPHRLTEHATGRGAVLVDDAIATIPQATLRALDVYADRRVHLLFGGFDRGIDYGPLKARLRDAPPATISVFGPVGRRVLGEMPTLETPVNYRVSLYRALSDLAPRVGQGDIVLLSPAAVSHDEFDNFEHRGTEFVRTMTALLSD